MKKHKCQFCSAYFNNYEDFYNHEYEHIKVNKRINFRTPLLLSLWQMSMYGMGIWLGISIANKEKVLFSALFSVLFFGLLFFLSSLVIENYEK